MTRRRSPLPSNWSTIRHEILQRDHYTCQLQYVGCEGLATEADHINSPTNHHPNNLQAACTHCHNKKTAQQANQARKAKYSKRLRREEHPGRIEVGGDPLPRHL